MCKVEEPPVQEFVPTTQSELDRLCLGVSGQQSPLVPQTASVGQVLPVPSPSKV